MLDLSVHLGERFFTAHRQNRVAEGDEDPDESDCVWQLASFEPSKRIG